MWSPDQQPALRDALARAAQGESARFDGRTGQGTGQRYWEIAISPVRGAGGATTHLLAISTETTAHVEAARLEREQREQAEREISFAATVAHELRHRLKNQLAVVNAVTKLLSRHTGTARDLARKLEEKLLSLAAAQDLLATRNERALTARQAVFEVLRASGAGERVEVIGMPEAPLPDESVQQLALLLGELQTNALKHGALRSDDGSVRLSGSVQDGVLTLQWEEACAAPVDEVEVGAGGFQLIRRLGSAGGRQPSIEWRPNGIAVALHVRAER